MQVHMRIHLGFLEGFLRFALPKKARTRSDETIAPAPKITKMQQSKIATLPSDNLSLDVVMISGATLATLSVDSSYSVRQLLDDKIASLVQERAHSKNARIRCSPNMLFDHQSLREAGASEGATLTLTLEAAPVKLRTIQATFYISPLCAKNQKTLGNQFWKLVSQRLSWAH